MRTSWPSWGCLSLRYLAFAGRLSAAEGVAAVLAGACGALVSLGPRAGGERALSLRGRWAAVSMREAWQLVRDVGRVGATLLRVTCRGRGHRGEVVFDRDAAECHVGAGAGRAGPLLGVIDRAHDGVVGDYVVWLVLGLALFSVSSAAALHAG